MVIGGEEVRNLIKHFAHRRRISLARSYCLDAIKNVGPG